MSFFSPDEQPPPMHGPKCPGPMIHKWMINILEGKVQMKSGCSECDLAVLLDDDVIEMDDIPARLLLIVHDHDPNDIWYHWEVLPWQR